MTNDEIHAIYDAMITAEASGDYVATFVYNDRLNKIL